MNFLNARPNATLKQACAALIMATIAVAIASATPAIAIDEQNPDWPCVQRKVNVLTSAQIWDGPSVDKGLEWRKDKDIYKFVPVLLNRRIEIEKIEESVEKFAQSVPQSERDQRLTLLFAGILDRTNSVRKKVLSGIERFQKRQEARSKELERQGKALAELSEKANNDKSLEEKVIQARNRYDWDARIFKERQGNIPIACEVPVLIEQRAFALGRAIRIHMSE